MLVRVLANVAVPIVTLEAVKTLALWWLAVAVAGGVGVLLLWWRSPTPLSPILPPQRLRATPWGALAVLAAIALYVFWQLVLINFLDELWTTVAAMPLQTLTILLFLRRTVGAELYQVGLTLHRWRKDVVSGYLLFLVAAPLTLGTFMAVQYVLGEQPAPHFAEEYVAKHPGWVARLGLCLVAIVAAPILEELLYRGILQPWLVQTPFAADLILLAALATAISLGMDRNLRQFQLAQWWPVVFLLVVGPGYLLFDLATRRWLVRPGVGRAIFASSLLFAASHQAWPAPIPLFLLGLALGWLAYRTQSIVGCIVTHALFNAVSVLKLISE